MTTWNYRVVRKKINGEARYELCEVFYHEDGEIDCWSPHPCEPASGSQAQLRNDIHAFLKAFSLPVLEERCVCGRLQLVDAPVPSGKQPGLIDDYAGRTSRASAYIAQMLGHHLLLRKEPALHQAYAKVDAALAELLATATELQDTPDAPPAAKIA